MEDFPTDEHDVPLSIIVTPDDVTSVSNPRPAPDGIRWDELPDNALEEMPVLAEVKKRESG